ncbi:hypothetical protein TELCIR_21472, partial [Teladorsagia circumcincta]
LSTAVAKKKLDLEKKEKKRVGASETVAVPVHRQASERIKGAVGFIELKCAAKEKLNQMQKMRALISYREAKYRYAAKIKSKR